MHRAFVLALMALATVALAATTGAPVRWIAYIAGSPGDLTGELHLVRSDGGDDRVLLAERVLAADLGPGAEIYAVQEEADPPADAPANSALLRIRSDGSPEPVTDDSGYYVSVAAAADGHFAFFRQVIEATQPPAHLAPVIEDLRDAGVPILAPPEEPPGTGEAVADSSEDGYRLLFSNDPEGELAHADQVNIFVEATTAEAETGGAFSQPAGVRGTEGEFSCGASACFLTWQELDVTYTVGEFGDEDLAVELAESLRPMEELAGAFWRSGEGTPVPELIVQDPAGETTSLESIEGFCECGFMPAAWSADGKEVLVVASSEGYSTLQTYDPNGKGRPAKLSESSEHDGASIVDAAYGPGGVWMLLTGEGGPPGDVRTLDGTVRLRDVRAFDIAGSILGYVTDDGDVIVRDLATGEERTVGSGALDVSVSPDTVPAGAAAPPLEEGEGFPVLLVVLVGLGAASLAAGAMLIRLARRRS